MANEASETIENTAQDEAASGQVSSASMVSRDDFNELNNRFLRLAADFENFRKRQAQEREHLLKYGAQSSLEHLLPVLDNLERAQQSLSDKSSPEMLYKSFEMLSQQLLEAVQAAGLTRMSPQGAAFDPEHHEAVSQVETEDHPDHSVMQVYREGYKLHDRVLRPAQVVVAVQPAGKASTEEQANPFQQAVSE